MVQAVLEAELRQDCVLLLCRFRELHEKQSNTALPVATLSQGLNGEHPATWQLGCVYWHT